MNQSRGRTPLPQRVAGNAPESTTAVVANRVVDPTLFALYMKLRQFELKYPSIGSCMELPKLCVCGEQSAGKSSLLQLYLGFPCALVQGGTGTRCPVSYTLKYNPDRTEPVVVQPSNVTIQGLAGWIEQQMKEIARTVASGFSDVVLPIVVEYCDYMNIELVDLPGLVEGSSKKVTGSDGVEIEEKVCVQQLVAKFIEDPAYIVIFLRVANDDIKNDIGHTKIADMFNKRTRHKDADHFIRVGTKLRGVAQVGAEVDVHFTSVESLHPKIYFTELMPPLSSTAPLFDWAKANFDERYKYLQDVPALEEQWINQWMQTSQAGGDFTRKWRSRMGIHVITDAIRSTWARLFQQLLKSIKTALQSRSNAAVASIALNKEKIKHLDEKDLRENYQDYMVQFYDTMKHYMGGQAESGLDSSSNGKTFLEEAAIIVENYEAASVNSLANGANQWAALRGSEDMLKELADPGNANVQDFSHMVTAARLCGGSAFKRLDEITLFQLLAYAPDVHDEDQIRVALGNVPGGVASSPMVWHAVRQLVKKDLTSAFSWSDSWLSQHYLKLYYQSCQDVQKRLISAGKLSSLESHTLFLDKVRHAFLDSVMLQLQVARQLFQATLHYRTSLLSLDATVRMVQTLSLVDRAISFSGDTTASYKPPALNKPHPCDIVATANQPPNFSAHESKMSEIVKAVTLEMYATSLLNLATDLGRIFTVNVFQYVAENVLVRESPYAAFRKRLENMTKDELYELSSSQENVVLVTEVSEEIAKLEAELADNKRCISDINSYLAAPKPTA